MSLSKTRECSDFAGGSQDGSISGSVSNSRGVAVGRFSVEPSEATPVLIAPLEVDECAYGDASDEESSDSDDSGRVYKAVHDYHDAPGAWKSKRGAPSLPEVYASVDVHDKAGWFRRVLAFAGPGLAVAVGYMDPGNWATDLEGGARFGYTLLAVVLASSGIAIVLQHLALKLGIATGRDLAQACRDSYSRPVSVFLWVLAEIAIAATDLAEVIGSAIALDLLFGIPLVWGILITAADVLVVLALQNKSIRSFEAVVGVLVLLIFVCFAYELAVARPHMVAILEGFVPSSTLVTNSKATYISVGILGATVMPHNLFLHSSLVQTRAFPRTASGKRDAVKFATIETVVFLVLAFFVNSAILILSAAAFHGTEHEDVAEIDDAYRLLSPTLGAKASSTLFAVALLASGQSSTLTGTLSGQIVVEGFIEVQVRPWMRRLLTRGLAIVPAVIVALMFGSGGVNNLLVLSQVILSLQLSFAVVPLVSMTNSKAKMGEELVNSWPLCIVSGLLTTVIVCLNMYLVVQFLFL